jgi:hypothetical protein
MNRNQEDHLTNQEKNLVAMGAAMGAGCRTCADKLYEIALSLKIPKNEMLKAFNLGLDAKAEAVKTMEVKISSLIGDDKMDNTMVTERFTQNFASLIRVASFVAANSAPDVLSEIKKAERYGIKPDQIQMCISLAKMVRKNAGAFSDQEISDKVGSFEFDMKEVCCPISSNPKSTSSCSCG